MDEIGVAVSVALLAALHVVGGRLRFITYVPRSGWLSFAGGVSVSYVFIHLLPEVARGSRVLADELGEVAFVEDGIWAIGLLGFTFFYWVEGLTRRSRRELREVSSSAGAFWVGIVSYALYNSIIGYLLHERAESGSVNLALFVVAMGLHFLVNDFALREHHKHRYASFGRWLLVAAIGVGAVIGSLGEVRELGLVSVLAFIAGGVILNVFKEELPTEAESRLPTFLAGAGVYALILLAL